MQQKLVLRDLVASTVDLAALPGTVVALLDILKDDTCSADKVLAVLERDAAMTANVLRVANSAMFGARRRIGSARDALVLLGNRAVATLAFAAGLAPVMRRDLVGYGIARQRFWDHCLLSATATALVAGRLAPDANACEMFTAGLVHDVGMLVLDRHLLATRAEIPAARPAFQVCALERRVLGFDHAQAGRILAVQWGFPEFLVQAIAHHHDPVGANGAADAVGLVSMGDLVAQMLTDGVEPDALPQVVAHVRGRGIPLDFLHELKDDLAVDFEGALARATLPAAGVS